MTDKLTEIAIAICPKVKPWMDDPDVIQSGVCDCAGDVETNYGPGQTACWITMNEIAVAAIQAHEAALAAEGLVIVPRVPTQDMIEAKRQAWIGMIWPGSPEEMSNAVDRAEWQAMLAALEPNDAD